MCKGLWSNLSDMTTFQESGIYDITFLISGHAVTNPKTPFFSSPLINYHKALVVLRANVTPAATHLGGRLWTYYGR